MQMRTTGKRAWFDFLAMLASGQGGVERRSEGAFEGRSVRL